MAYKGQIKGPFVLQTEKEENLDAENVKALEMLCGNNCNIQTDIGNSGLTENCAKVAAQHSGQAQAEWQHSLPGMRGQ